ncbi:MAG: hypothetical protein F6J94_21935 [Moorea sp. SIO1F2]|uniref:DUF3598 family protein n=1 Tax=unclassified Moorena TaxID=2683338 RepID=UPI0013B95219|nr:MULTISPECIES: DUF3598 family protein [unclassified Moorena]NEN94616.1 hypothetical protein [Moorena sp. SIO3I7]NEO08682.1 hypothetical protein [Moorena sp. SIO3I8]NET84480.1 hypothetical protein [Moorena sp. SIO1F2]
MSDFLTQNWEKFLEIQAIGDWNGIWTRLAGNGELVERCLDAVAHGAWVCVRNLRPHRCLPRGNPLWRRCIAIDMKMVGVSLEHLVLTKKAS